MDLHRNDNMQEVEDMLILEVKDMNDLDYIRFDRTSDVFRREGLKRYSSQ